MREIAEAYLGKKVTHAVITVPAYFMMHNVKQQRCWNYFWFKCYAYYK